MYVIKVYKIKNVVQKQIKTWDIEYVCDLPYLFPEKPTNICNQMNEMFKGSFEHIISIK
jgi:hypothetical protein